MTYMVKKKLDTDLKKVLKTLTALLTIFATNLKKVVRL